MKNVTVTLDEQIAAWARRHAAKHGLSLSRFLGTVLEQKMHESREYERSMREYLSKLPVKLKAAGVRYPSRDSLHERNDLC